jgi:hypothetical protein
MTSRTDYMDTAFYLTRNMASPSNPEDTIMATEARAEVDRGDLETPAITKGQASASSHK